MIAKILKCTINGSEPVDQHGLTMQDVINIADGDMKPLLAHIYGTNVPLSVAKNGVPYSVVKLLMSELEASKPVYSFAVDGTTYSVVNFLGNATVAQFEDLQQTMLKQPNDMLKLLEMAAILYLPEGVAYSDALASDAKRQAMLRNLPANITFGMSNFFLGAWIRLGAASQTAGQVLATMIARLMAAQTYITAQKGQLQHTALQAWSSP